MKSNYGESHRWVLSYCGFDLKSTKGKRELVEGEKGERGQAGIREESDRTNEQSQEGRFLQGKERPPVRKKKEGCLPQGGGRPETWSAGGNQGMVTDRMEGGKKQAYHTAQPRGTVPHPNHLRKDCLLAKGGKTQRVHPKRRGLSRKEPSQVEKGKATTYREALDKTTGVYERKFGRFGGEKRNLGTEEEKKKS